MMTFTIGLGLFLGALWGGLRLWTRTTPHAEISGALGVYVKRWHLYWNEQRLLIVVHRFFGPDQDPPHNHSGWSMSWVLGGRGTEVYYNRDGEILKTRKRFPGQLVFRTESVIHHVHSDPNHPLTTLFVALPLGKTWGFWRKEGFVDAATFCKSKQGDKRFRWLKKPKPSRAT